MALTAGVKPDREQSYQEAQRIMREHNEIQQQQERKKTEKQVQRAEKSNDRGI